MTYDLHVVDPAGEATSETVDALLEIEDDDSPLTPALAALCADLASSHPFGEDGDGSPWASWPLEQPEGGGRICSFNIVWSQMEAGADAVIAAAARHGLAVFDPQTGELLAAGQQPDLPPQNWWEPGVLPANGQAAPPAKRRWWRRHR